jgi:curved DNA-binding protein CbpA
MTLALLCLRSPSALRSFLPSSQSLHLWRSTSYYYSFCDSPSLFSRPPPSYSLFQSPSSSSSSYQFFSSCNAPRAHNRHSKSQKSSQPNELVLFKGRRVFTVDQDYYEVLGVSRTATSTEIKRAYLSLAKVFHPDRNPGNAEAEQQFKIIGSAYSVLSNPRTREIYNQHGNTGMNAQVGMDEFIRQLFGAGAFDIFVGDLPEAFNLNQEDELPKNEFEDRVAEQRKKIKLNLSDLSEDDFRKELEKLEELKDLSRKRKLEILQIQRKILEDEELRIQKITEKLALKLIDFIRDYKEEDNGLAFRGQITKLAQELADAPGGVGLLEIVGNAYVNQSRRYFDDGRYPFGLSRFFATGFSFYQRISLFSNMAIKTRKMKRMYAEYEEQKKDEKKDPSSKKIDEFKLRKEGIETLWGLGQILVSFFYSPSLTLHIHFISFFCSNSFNLILSLGHRSNLPSL